MPDPDLGQCQCCGAEPAVGVAAIPGMPTSIAWGRECLRRGAVPLWAADLTVSEVCNPAAPSWSDVADWFRKQLVPLNGNYVRVDTLMLETFNCDHAADDELVRDGSCPMCLKGRVIGIREARDARP